MIRKELDSGTLFKPIIGASIQNPILARQLGLIYCRAGAKLIDVRAEQFMINAVRDGINAAGGGMAVIASLTPSRRDPHFLKASVGNLCQGCGRCEAICPHSAIAVSDRAVITIANCRGCSHCLDACPVSAISLAAAPQDHGSLGETVSECIAAGADTLELHLAGMSADKVSQVIVSLATEIADINAKNFPISVCVGSLKSSPAEILEVVEMLVGMLGVERFFIQADGATMAATKRGLALQSLAVADLIKSAFPSVAVVCSGGTTEATWKVAEYLGVPIAGVGMGLRSFEVVKEYLGENVRCLEAATAAARTLFCPYKKIDSQAADAANFRGAAIHSLHIKEV